MQIDIQDKDVVIQLMDKLKKKFQGQFEQKLVSFNNQGELLVSLFDSLINNKSVSTEDLLGSIDIINNQMKYHQRDRVIKSYQNFVDSKDLETLGKDEMLKILKLNYLFSLNHYCLDLHSKFQESLGEDDAGMALEYLQHCPFNVDLTENIGDVILGAN